MPKYGNYCCPKCGTIFREVAVPFGTKFTEMELRCSTCGATAENFYIPPKLEWLPEIGRMSAGNGPTFTKFDCYDATGKLVTVDSISALRHIERESEKMAADGVGQGRMVWRDLANDRSNKDVHAFSKSGWEAEDYPGTPTKADFAKLNMLTEEQVRQKQGSDAPAPLALPPE